jgi:hypothetical protein
MSAYLNITKTYNVGPTPNKKIISYSLYGINNDLDVKRGFYKGIFVNYELAKTVYPGWKVRVYMPDNEPAEFIEKLAQMKDIELFLVSTNLCLRAMRYLPNDDPLVSIWISRDLDSIVTFREKAAVYDWMMHYPDKELHIMCDHIGHRWTIPGGMFGKKNNNNDTSFTNFIVDFCNETDPNEYEVDCTIAEKFFYKQDNYIQHHSYGTQLKNSVPFPSHDRTNHAFVGIVANMHGYFHLLKIENKYGPFPKQRLPPHLRQIAKPCKMQPLKLPTISFMLKRGGGMKLKFFN